MPNGSRNMEIPDKPIKKEKEISEEIERLLLDLKDKNLSVQWTAVKALGKIGQPAINTLSR